jgi:glycosyltransferase involved in cell wall biosynthesis
VIPSNSEFNLPLRHRYSEIIQNGLIDDQMNETRGCFIYFGDVRYDSRLQNIAGTLARSGQKITVLQAADRDEHVDLDGIQVISIKTNNRVRGIARFVWFYCKIIPAALKVKAHFFCAADLYSLPVAARAAKRNKAGLFYDSREIYSALGVLARKKAKQNIWQRVEKLFIKQAVTFTSGEMDSARLAELYRIPFPGVIHNYPFLKDVLRNDSLHAALKLSNDRFILLYQGMLAPGRGIEFMLDILKKLGPKYALALIGDGPMFHDLRAKAETPEWKGRLYVMGRVPHSQLLEYTASAGIGLALIEGISLSYFTALPNKLFEYIMCGTPPLASDLPAMKKVIDEHGTGRTVRFGDVPQALQAIEDIRADLTDHQNACAEARLRLNWQKQEQELLNIFKSRQV